MPDNTAPSPSRRPATSGQDRDELGIGPVRPEYAVTEHRPLPGRYEKLHRVAVGDWECKDCGALVIDREAHDRFHAVVEPQDVPRIRVYKGGS